MTLSAKTWFFAVVTTLAATVQPIFAAGHPGGGTSGGASRPAARPPVTVNRSAPARSPGSSTKVKALSDDASNSNRVAPAPSQVPAKSNKVQRNQPSDDDKRVAPTTPAPDSSAPVETRHTKPSDQDAPPVSTPVHNTPVQTTPPVSTPVHNNPSPTTGTPAHTTPVHNTTPPTAPPPADNNKPIPPSVTHIHVDPGLFPNIRPNLGNIGARPGNGSSGNSGSRPTLPTPPPGSHKHIDPLPGEHGTPLRPTSPGTSNPGSGTGTSGGGNNGLGDLLGQLPSLLSGAGGSGTGGSGAAASGANEAAPAEAAAPAPATDSVASSPAQATPAQTKDGLDMELIDVRLVEDGSLDRKTGPRYRLFYRNAGTVEVPRFHATVAVDIGQKLTEKAEIVTVDAAGVKPGKTQTVDVRLPVEVLTMGIDYEGRPVAFNALVALIDSDDDLAETNEENNILVFSRDKIQSVK